MSTTTILFVYKWQTLIGSTLGPFLAIFLSLIGFFATSKYKSWTYKKESIRLVEVSITRTINDLYSTRKKLEDFIDRLRKLAKDVRATTGDKTYSLERTNFPAAREIFFNTDLPNLKFGSIYLHNQILFTDSGIKEINSWLIKMEKDFESMATKNEFLVGLSPKPSAHDQRTQYAENLEIFADAIKNFVIHIKREIKTVTQIKIYNLKLMQKRIRTIWKYESGKFKYFKTSNEKNEYKKWSNIIDRINNIIDKEVELSLADAEENFQKMKI